MPTLVDIIALENSPDKTNRAKLLTDLKEKMNAVPDERDNAIRKNANVMLVAMEKEAFTEVAVVNNLAGNKNHDDIFIGYFSQAQQQAIAPLMPDASLKRDLVQRLVTDGEQKNEEKPPALTTLNADQFIYLNPGKDENPGPAGGAYAGLILKNPNGIPEIHMQEYSFRQSAEGDRGTCAEIIGGLIAGHLAGDLAAPVFLVKRTADANFEEKSDQIYAATATLDGFNDLYTESGTKAADEERSRGLLGGVRGKLDNSAQRNQLATWMSEQGLKSNLLHDMGQIVAASLIAGNQRIDTRSMGVATIGGLQHIVCHDFGGALQQPFSDEIALLGDRLNNFNRYYPDEIRLSAAFIKGAEEAASKKLEPQDSYNEMKALFEGVGQDKFLTFAQGLHPEWNTWDNIPGNSQDDKILAASESLYERLELRQASMRREILALKMAHLVEGYKHALDAGEPAQSTYKFEALALEYRDLIKTDAQKNQFEENLRQLLKVPDVSAVTNLIQEYPLTPEQKPAPAAPEVAKAQVEIQRNLGQLAANLTRVQEFIELLDSDNFNQTLRNAMQDLSAISEKLKNNDDPRNLEENLSKIETLVKEYLQYCDNYGLDQASIGVALKEPVFNYTLQLPGLAPQLDEKENDPPTLTKVIESGIKDCNVFKIGNSITFADRGKIEDSITLSQDASLLRRFRGDRGKVIVTTREFENEELTHQELAEMKLDASEISAAYRKIAGDPKSDGLKGDNQAKDSIEAGILLLARLVAARNELGDNTPDRLNLVIEKTETCLRENIEKITDNPSTTKSLLNLVKDVATHPEKSAEAFGMPELDFFEKTRRSLPNPKDVNIPQAPDSIPNQYKADNPLATVHGILTDKLNNVQTQAAIEEKEANRENFSKDNLSPIVLKNNLTQYQRPDEIKGEDRADVQNINPASDTKVVTYTMGGNSGFCSVQHRNQHAYKSDFLGEFKSTENSDIMERAAREVETFRASLPPEIRNSPDRCYGMILTCGKAMPDNLAYAIKAYCEFNGYPFRAILKAKTSDNSLAWKEYLKTHQEDVEKQLGMLIGPIAQRTNRLNDVGESLKDLNKMAATYSEVRTLDAAPSIIAQHGY